jgi:hypothetical protein
LKSENESLPNFSVYLSCAASATPPKAASDNTVTIAGMFFSTPTLEMRNMSASTFAAESLLGLSFQNWSSCSNNQPNQIPAS